MSEKEIIVEEENVTYQGYDVRMAYQAGHAQLEPWPCKGRTVHAGVGWFHPFGRSN